ncbi:hypothetical protein V6N11_020577 [Hibiscus sabdariffa]|uniref:Uncharacterized protein n=1 Tax=Hibiscus sabdariffa TaxID=183260 RepID=A0ABR2Q8U9_9ROSI
MMVTNPSPIVVGQEKRVAAELMDLYKVEENFLMQKSRVQFIKEGDQNSSFFFRQVAVRQRANSIRVLQDSQGSNLDTFESISSELVRFFSGSLSVVDDNVEPVSDDLLKELLGVELTAEMQNSLIAPVLPLAPTRLHTWVVLLTKPGANMEKGRWRGAWIREFEIQKSAVETEKPLLPFIMP